MSYPRTLAELIDVTVACEPDRVALVDSAGEWTFAELDRRANQVANGLLAHGCTTGHRVAVLIGNESRFIEALLGIWRSGAIAVLPNTRLAAGQIIAQTRHCEPSVVLASADHEKVAAELAGSGPGSPRVLSGTAYDVWRERQPVERPAVEISPDEVCLQPYTSGSTGVPKGVLLAHLGQLHNARAVARAELFTEEDRALVSAPIFHANAMAGAVMPLLVVGGSVVILPGFDTEPVAAAVARYRCTFMTGVPSMYQALLDAGVFDRYDLTSLSVVACGSAPVTSELLARIQAALPGADVVEGYGLTEGGPVVTKNPRVGVRRLGSIGVPLPGTDVRLMNEGCEVATGEVGEIQVRAPGVAVGFHQNAAAFDDRMTEDGWLRTGDLAEADTDGYLYFRGRMDDMINVAGENVYPQTVESLIRLYPGVAEVAVVSAPHERKGQVPVAFVVASAGVQIDPDAIRQFCLTEGPAFAHPRRVAIVERLPVGPTGKLDRRILTERAYKLAEESADRGRAKA